MKLILDKVTKSYGSNLALNSFSATLEPGIHALLGPGQLYSSGWRKYTPAAAAGGYHPAARVTLS